MNDFEVGMIIGTGVIIGFYFLTWKYYRDKINYKNKIKKLRRENNG
jgi:hypothetical protein